MASFGHGGNVKEISRENTIEYEKIIDFSANINPLGMPRGIKKAIVDNLNTIEQYPDITYFELKNSIIEFENSKLKYQDSNCTIEQRNLILGNGAAEVLFNVVKGINPKNALILAPTFSEYEEAINAVGGNITYYNLKEENKFNIKEDILDCIDESLDLIFICNPNNPTGVVTSKMLLNKILIRAKKCNVIIIIDESFLDFIKEDLSMIDDVKKYDNLIIIKSLTKFFALPGIRIGYGICNNINLIKKINDITPAWNINIIAEIATKNALKDEKYINETINFIKKERTYLYEQLKKLKQLKIYEPSVNFILIKTFNRIKLKDMLLKKNILIRSCNNYYGLDENYYRVAVRTHKENITLIEALHDIFI